MGMLSKFARPAIFAWLSVLLSEQGVGPAIEGIQGVYAASGHGGHGGPGEHDHGDGHFHGGHGGDADE